MEKPSLNYGDLPNLCSACQGLVRHRCWRYERYIDSPTSTGCQGFEAALAPPGMDRALVKRLGWLALWALLTVICISQSYLAARMQDRVAFVILSAIFGFISGRTWAWKPKP